MDETTNHRSSGNQQPELRLPTFFFPLFILLLIIFHSFCLFICLLFAENGKWIHFRTFIFVSLFSSRARSETLPFDWFLKLFMLFQGLPTMVLIYCISYISCLPLFNTSLLGLRLQVRALFKHCHHWLAHFYPSIRINQIKADQDQVDRDRYSINSN